jgi:MFS family permease
MTLEHAPAGRRAFITSFTLRGTQAGQILATAVFLPVAALPEHQLMTWGWRVPFWLSLLVVVVGLWIRRTIDETPPFRQEAVQGEVAKLPVAVLFRDHWADLLRVVFAAFVAVVSTIFSVYALSFAVNTVKIAMAEILWVGVLANVLTLAAIPAWAILADRVGRKRVSEVVRAVVADLGVDSDDLNTTYTIRVADRRSSSS